MTPQDKLRPARLVAGAPGGEWTHAERADSAVCAALLGTGLYWWAAVLLNTVLLSPVGSEEAPWTVRTLCWGLGLLATCLTVRVMLDAALFKLMAQGGPDGALHAAQPLDAALQRVLKVPARAPGVRTLADRIAGAARLYRALVAVSLGHGLLLLGVTLQRHLL